ncbi:hypothetical protein OAW27_00260 [bacterium]|jgi:hypothetical protein|nr:hypothetical protein [bacterium]
MAFEVKVYKPNKDGKLECTQKLSSDEISEQHWDKFNRDNKYAVNYNYKSFNLKKATYHRIGVDLRVCAEDNCKQIVEEPLSVTCSPACKSKRTKRKRRESKARSRARGNK